MQHELDWYEDDDEDWQNTDELDEDADEPACLPCPHCGEDILEDAPQCPHCGEYVTHSTCAWHGKPLPWIVVGALGTAAVIYALLLAW